MMIYKKNLMRKKIKLNTIKILIENWFCHFNMVIYKY